MVLPAWLLGTTVGIPKGLGEGAAPPTAGAPDTIPEAAALPNALDPIWDPNGPGWAPRDPAGFPKVVPGRAFAPNVMLPAAPAPSNLRLSQ